MVYVIPFFNAVKFQVLSTSLGSAVEYYVRMKVFLLMCLSYCVNVTNNWLVAQPVCGFMPKQKIVFIENTISSILIVVTLCLTKAQAEVISEMVIIFILSLWTNTFPMHFFMKLGPRAAEYQDLFGSFTLESTAQPMQVLNEFNNSLIYASIFLVAGVQGYLGDWFLEITLREVTRNEQIAMQTLLSTPVIIGATIKYTGRTFSTYLLDWLPYGGLGATVVPAVWTIYNIHSPPNPLYFNIPHEKWLPMIRGMGYCFFCKWFYLQIKLCIKYNLLTYEGMLTLRLYFITRMIINFSKLSLKDWVDWDVTWETFWITFQQDYLAVLGGSAFISRIVFAYAKKAIKLSEGSKNDYVLRHALGFVSTAYIILGFINVAFECRLCERMVNFFEIIKFLMFMTTMFTYTAAWTEAYHCASAVELHKHMSYVKALGMLILVNFISIICFRDEDDAPKPTSRTCNSQVCNYFGPEEDCIFCEVYEGFVVLVFFAMQVEIMSVLSIICIVFLMWYSWTYMHEETEENFEARVATGMMAMVLIEMCGSFFIFDRISSYCHETKAQRMVLLAMTVLNIYSTVIERGLFICCKVYGEWKELATILEHMKLLDEDDLEDYEDPECVICEDYVDENGRLAECGHLYHTFCIREWINEYGAICPECNAELRTERSSLKIVNRDSSSEVIDPALNPEMLKKIMEEMDKFDYKTSFFSEVNDFKKDDGDDDEEEWGDDDDW